MSDAAQELIVALMQDVQSRQEQLRALLIILMFVSVAMLWLVATVYLCVADRIDRLEKRLIEHTEMGLWDGTSPPSY